MAEIIDPFDTAKPGIVDPFDAVSPTPTSAESVPLTDRVMHGAGDLAAGAVRGAGSIGATLLAPYDIAKAALAGKGLSLDSNRQRRADMDYGLEAMGADPASGAFATGKIGTEIAGTLGVGGVLAKGAMAAGKALPAIAPYMPKLATALESGGFRVNPASMVGPLPAANLASRAGDLALRTGAAATLGGASAGMVDPEAAGAGALIGGAMPAGVQLAGAAGRGLKNLAGSTVQHGLGMTTGAGREAIKTAYESGKSGAQSFVDNMRGKVPMVDVLDDAKAALAQMRVTRGEEYRKGMAAISGDKSVLDFTPINAAIRKVQSIGSFKGQPINSKSASTVQELSDQVSAWANLNPAEYHTPEGLDALKKAIGDIRDNLDYGKPARRAADEVYNAVKDQITKQAPTYARTMKGYSEASDLISEIERSLVGGKKTAADTAMRKLQSLMRNNVNTNYGNRLDLARSLEQQGGRDILPAVAGQALNSATPRGLQGLAATGAGLYGIANPAALAALPLGSPRLMGEAAYGAGKLSDLLGGGLNRMASNPALQNRLGMLADKSTYLPLMTVAPSVAFSR